MGLGNLISLWRMCSRTEVTKVNAAFSSSLGFDSLTLDETLHREGSAYGDAARRAILAVYKRG
jgi:hypothetical protein